MKNLFALLVCVGLSVSLAAEHKIAPQKLSKKDREELMHMFMDFMDGMEKKDAPIKDQMNDRWAFWEAPVTRLERSIEQLNETAQNIQNYIIDVTSDNQNDEFKEKVAKGLKKIKHELEVISAQLAHQSKVIGDLKDISVNPADFVSVQDIDDAHLSLVQILKTNLRAVLENQFIS
jgi:hypothetical protein